MSARRPRVLVLMVPPSTRAEASIAAALASIPAGVLARFEIEAAVITDVDSGNAGASAAALALPFPLTLLHNPERQGYGGNQKIGFHYGIEHGFDAVVLVHGGGKYDPACLPDVLSPLADGRADAVFGSRMLGSRAARGSMPLYKRGANRILTGLQNRLLKSQLTEFHSGYRAYSIAALRRIPFHLNSDAFHFDTEITIQLLLSGSRIVEVPIPAYSSEELSIRNGVGYSWRVIATCVRARAQELSLFFDRKFDCVPSTASNIHYKPRLGFESTHTLALSAVPDGARVLDIGCAGGYFSRLLRERGCHTTGIDRFPLDPANVLDEFHLHDLNRTPLPVDLARFDHAVMLDVLEHLQSPETFVDEFRAAAAKNPGIRLIVSTPNIAFVVARLMLLLGRFNYGKRGILDLTHTRLFTFGTLRRLFEQSGYEVEAMRGVPAPFPLALGDTGKARALLQLQRLLIRVSRTLFAFQIFAVVRPKPGLAYLLERAEVASGSRIADAADSDRQAS